VLNYYRKLIHLRNNHPALATGRTWLVKTDRPEVAAFLRYRETRFKAVDRPDARAANGRPSIDVVLVVVNLSDNAVDVCSVALDEGQPLQGRRSAQDLLGNLTCLPLDIGDKGDFSGYKLGPLPPRTAAIIELKPM